VEKRQETGGEPGTGEAFVTVGRDPEQVGLGTGEGVETVVGRR
jgi:hypothetical protein